MISIAEREVTAESLTYEERLAFFEEWQKNLLAPKNEPVSDEALKRESLYEERINRQR
ncbi:MAG: hypothetical protein AB1757_23130 [Acidobacteriota bacterium]